MAVSRLKPGHQSSELYIRIKIFLSFIASYQSSIDVESISDRWRNGSAFDSRSKGYPFKSGVVHVLMFFLSIRSVCCKFGMSCSGLDAFVWLSFRRSCGQSGRKVDAKADRSINQSSIHRSSRCCIGSTLTHTTEKR